MLIRNQFLGALALCSIFQFLICLDWVRAENVLRKNEIVMAIPSLDKAFQADNADRYQQELEESSKATAAELCKLRKGESSELVSAPLRDWPHEQAGHLRPYAKTIVDGQIVFKQFEYSYPWYLVDEPDLSHAEKLALVNMIGNCTLWVKSAVCTGLLFYFVPDWSEHRLARVARFAMEASAFTLHYYWANGSVRRNFERLKNLSYRAFLRKRLNEEEVQARENQGIQSHKYSFSSLFNNLVAHRVYEEVNCTD